jgi:hypothetical protein
LSERQQWIDSPPCRIATSSGGSGLIRVQIGICELKQNVRGDAILGKAPLTPPPRPHARRRFFEHPASWEVKDPLMCAPALSTSETPRQRLGWVLSRKFCKKGR